MLKSHLQYKHFISVTVDWHPHLSPTTPLIYTKIYKLVSVAQAPFWTINVYTQHCTNLKKKRACCIDYTKLKWAASEDNGDKIGNPPSLNSWRCLWQIFILIPDHLPPCFLSFFCSVLAMFAALYTSVVIIVSMNLSFFFSFANWLFSFEKKKWRWLYVAKRIKPCFLNEGHYCLRVNKEPTFFFSILTNLTLGLVLIFTKLSIITEKNWN